jgi:hypothetical protein
MAMALAMAMAMAMALAMAMAMALAMAMAMAMAMALALAMAMAMALAMALALALAMAMAMASVPLPSKPGNIVLVAANGDNLYAIEVSRYHLVVNTVEVINALEKGLDLQSWSSLSRAWRKVFLYRGVIEQDPEEGPDE